MVTGEAGFIGSHLVDRLISDGWTVTILDNFSSGRVENVKYHEDNLNVKIFNADLKKHWRRSMHSGFDVYNVDSGD